MNYWADFAIGARVSLLCQHNVSKPRALYTGNAYSAESEMPASACTRSMPGYDQWRSDALEAEVQQQGRGPRYAVN